MSDIYSNRLSVQVPYTPTAITYEYTTYQANDPLVHYLKSDLNYFGPEASPNSSLQTGVHLEPANTPSFPCCRVSARSTSAINRGVQIRQMVRPELRKVLTIRSLQSCVQGSAREPSDNWDFPTNKFPTVGWIGRVHRGTPWQTVYLKASDILAEPNPTNPCLGNVGTNTWAVWTGDLIHMMRPTTGRCKTGCCSIFSPPPE